ncbi:MULTISPECIES: hypothetical protein [Halobacteriales]|uniref:Uncharacterized protein n=2 Tax=Halobacteriales TaxID=2235 RepID=A0A1I0QY72_9EURY|nr:hypothetical protein [Natrinema salifodinae]SEW32804.1 hypothetical protein SAMN05216285_4149 [Natrinema salifodinae]
MSQHNQQELDHDDVSVAELVEQQQKLAARVGELEKELQQERQARQYLTRALAELEVSLETETQKIRNKYDRRTFNNKEDVFELEERVEKIERGEVDPGEVVANSNAGVDPSDLLPLHNMYLSAQNLEPDEHDLSKNQEIAARLFPYLGQYAYSNEGKMMLPSTKVKDILEREIATPELAQRLDVENPNANTIRRAMKFVGKFGKDMMEFDDSEKTNRIVIDRNAWVAYTKEIADVASESDDSTVNTADDAVNAENAAEDGGDEVAQEFDRLESASDYGVVSTDGGTTVNSDSGR